MPTFSLSLTSCAFVLLLAGCGSNVAQGPASKPSQANATPLVLLAGGSFRAPTEALVNLYKEKTGKALDISFGQSEDLLPHVKNHAQGDLFLTHDPYAQYTADANAELRTVVIGSLRPVLVVAKGNPKGIKSLADLAQPGLRVTLPNPDYSTCGEMVKKLLEQKGLLESVHANTGNAFMRSHGQIAEGIKLGHRDAGLMWNGVAKQWEKDFEVVPTPNEYERVRVTVTGLSYSKQQAEVEAFLKFAEEHGPQVFKEYGYADE
jgi:molybdate transport system substrate-binding protein